MRQPVPFGKYLLLDRISVGGMAEVYKAKTFGVEGFEKLVALKRILPTMGEDADFIRMFVDEAKIAGQLTHGSICQIFELGKSDEIHYIAMEYIWGKDLLQLQNRVKKQGEIIPAPVACHLVAKICEGLHYAHKKRDPLGKRLDIVHRDCSPQNILVSYQGEVKLIDFGIAKAASRSSRTNAGVLKGKFGYMSPEQVRGLPLDRRSDVFALGTILYETLTGHRLFLGESDFSTLEKVRNAEVAPPTSLEPGIPPEVERIVMRALERNPADRYQWASEMHEDLLAYLTKQESAVTAKAVGELLRRVFATEYERERLLMDEYRRIGPGGVIASAPVAPAPIAGDELGAVGGDDLAAPAPEPPEGYVGAIAAGRPASASGEFEDRPTEIFGEIGSLPMPAPSLPPAEQATVVTPAPMLSAAAGPLRPPPRPPAGSSEPTASMPAIPRPRPLHTTSRLTSLPAPGRRRRSGSLATDIGLGVGIAAVVLGLFVAGRLLFFSGSGTEAIAAAPTAVGTIAVVINDEHDAEVWLDGKRAGDIVGGAPFTLEGVPAGEHTVRATRAGVDPCEHEVVVGERSVEVVTCRFPEKVTTGAVVLDGLEPGQRVFVDDQEISPEAAAGSIALEAGREHVIAVQRGGKLAAEIRVAVEPGQVVRRDLRGAAKVADAAAAAKAARAERRAERAEAGPERAEAGPERTEPERTEPERTPPRRVERRDGDREATRNGVAESAETKSGNGYFRAYTRPWARVHIDGRDTGKMTPIAPRAKIELAPGKHRVTFVVGDQSFDYAIVIRPGETNSFVKDLPVK